MNICGFVITAEQFERSAKWAQYSMSGLVDWMEFMPSMSFENDIDPDIMTMKQLSQLDTDRCDVCFVDPGCMNYMTVLDGSDGSVVVLGNRIIRIAKSDDDENIHMIPIIQSRVAEYLAKKYANVVIPLMDPTKFGRVKDMSRRKRMDHAGFYDILRAKCAEHSSRMIVTHEEFTSMTCCYCGRVNPKPSSRDAVVCVSCDEVTQRDVNGTRNIAGRFIAIGLQDIFDVSLPYPEEPCLSVIGYGSIPKVQRDQRE